MKEPHPIDGEWVGVDLHVHTPASKDYRGSTEDPEYVDIIRRANEFAGRGRGRLSRKGRRDPQKPIACVAFTDHNSVEGFRKYRAIAEEARHLRDAIRGRDLANPLLKQLEDDLEVIGSVRVLMGVEVKAFPGIHLLVIFHETTQDREITDFLQDIYGRPYGELAGDPAHVTRCTLVEALNRVRDRFGERSFVVAPHIDTSDGIYEGLKEHGQARIEALKHPVIKALAFNRIETREKVRGLLSQPAYRRADELALIQSSDFHGQPGAVVGQPRTEVCVTAGKASFANLREALGHPARVKCSVDFTQDEYRRLTKGEFIAQFTAESGQCQFRESDFSEVASAVCAMANSQGGIVELEGFVLPEADRESYVRGVLEQFSGILEKKVQPPNVRFLH